MSWLSFVSLRSSLCSATMTWCRTQYLRQRINMTNRLPRACTCVSIPSNFSTKFDSDNRSEISPLNPGKRQKSRPRRKLFKERDIPDVDRATQVEDDEILENLPHSDRFGTGIGNFIEKTDKKNKTTRQTVLPKRWSETFGTMPVSELEQMEKSSVLENEKFEDELEKEEKTAKFYNHIRLARYNRRHIPNWYARRIMKLGKKGQIREAIEVFDKWMIEQDRVKPTAFEFAVLIKLLAEVGYTQKAFQLFYQMLGMKIYCADEIYSSLFNACANSPWPEDGLKWADKLHTTMLARGVNPNYITYLAMIKAYGRNGDLNSAFRLADEAVELYCDDHLLDNLLSACISDKEAGFRHAIVVSRKFRQLGVQPSIRSYNLLLRTVRDCGIGDPKIVKRLLVQERGNSRRLKYNDGLKDLEASSSIVESFNENMPNLLEDGEQHQGCTRYDNTDRELEKNVKSFQEIDKLLEKYQLNEEENDAGQVELPTEGNKTARNESRDLQIRKEWWELDVFENSDRAVTLKESEEEFNDLNEIKMPNILDPNENFSSVIQVDTVTKKEDRLALLGGMDGFLRFLERENIKPDIVTYTQLAQVVPRQLEDILIDEMWANGLKPDVDFYNLLMRKRTKHDKKGVWELYNRLRYEDNLPDVKTFSCLALACKHKEDGLQLIEDMMAADIMPNQYTMNCLMIASHFNFEYKSEILRKMHNIGIKPTKRFIEIVERQISDAKQALVEMERNDSLSHFKNQRTKKYRQRLQSFLRCYDRWTQDKIIEKEPHPWKHFMETKEWNKQ